VDSICVRGFLEPPDRPLSLGFHSLFGTHVCKPDLEIKSMTAPWAYLVCCTIWGLCLAGAGIGALIFERRRRNKR
jgi:hypothetical protein